VTEPARPSLRLRVEVASVPRPVLLRAAIGERLAGRAFPGAAEDAVARAVARAALGEPERGERPWR
jgi:hypothetical protein